MDAHDLNEFRTIKQLVDEYPDMITEHALRWSIRNANRNGLDKHLSKFGKEILVHVPGFTQWLLNGGNKPKRRPVGGQS